MLIVFIFAHFFVHYYDYVMLYVRYKSKSYRAHGSQYTVILIKITTMMLHIFTKMLFCAQTIVLRYPDFFI